MRARAAVRLSFLLGLLVVIPVLSVVGLGAYGEAIGGQSPSSPSAGPALTVLPPEARLGDALVVQGESWPPRSQVVIGLRLPPPSDRLLKLGSIVSSRAGKFSINLVLPRMLLAARGQALGLEASTVAAAPVSASVGLSVLSHDTNLTISVFDALTRRPVPDALVEISDAYGMSRLAGRTDADGRTGISGIVPGEGYRVIVRKLDYIQVEVAGLSVREGEDASVEIALDEARDGRLYLSGVLLPDGRTIRVRGIDLASHLPAEKDISLAGWLPQRVAQRDDNVLYATRFGAGWLVSDNAGLGGSRVPTLSQADLKAAWSAMRLVETSDIYDPQDVVVIRYLGISPRTGDLLIGANGRNGADIFQIDRNGGGFKSQFSVPGILVGPVISGDGRKSWFVDIGSGDLVSADLMDGRIDRRRFRALQGATALAPYDDLGVYVFLEPTGELLRFTAEGRAQVSVLPALVGGVQAMEVSPDGSRVLLASSRDSLMFVIDVASGEAVAIVPTSVNVTAFLFSPDSRFLYLIGSSPDAVEVMSWPGLALLDSIPWEEAPP